jgi:hypothetical protein
MVSCLGLRFLTLSSQGVAIAVPPILGTATIALGAVVKSYRGLGEAILAESV